MFSIDVEFFYYVEDRNEVFSNVGLQVKVMNFCIM